MMNLIMITILIAITVAIIFILFQVVFKRAQQENIKNIKTFHNHYTTINSKSYDELLFMNQALESLVKSHPTQEMFELEKELNYDIPISFKRADKQSSFNDDKIPNEQQIYGCMYYSDAIRLNDAVIRRMNELTNTNAN